jgi:hypothetical protein
LLGLSPECSREEVALRLTTFLKNEKLPELQEKATYLPSLSTRQRAAAIAFNLILTLGTLFLQLKIAPKATALGLGVGGIIVRSVGHDALFISAAATFFAKTESWIEESIPPFVKISKTIDYLFLFGPRKEKQPLPPLQPPTTNVAKSGNLGARSLLQP